MSSQTVCKNAYIEVHRNRRSNRITAFVFHVGEYSLPLLRLRPYQRIGDSIECNPYRLWAAGRVTYKQKILMENPGMPCFIFKDIGEHSDGLLSTAIRINSRSYNISEFSEQEPFTYKEIITNTLPVLEQDFQINGIKITIAIMLSESGPIQQIIIEAIEKSDKSRIISGCFFLNMFPKNITGYYAYNDSCNTHSGSICRPAKRTETNSINIPHAKWLAVYNLETKLGTVIYSPEFEKTHANHILITDRTQDFKMYHKTKPVELTVNPGDPYTITLAAGSVEADPDNWKHMAEKTAFKLAEQIKI